MSRVGELEMRSHAREEDQLRADMVALRERAVVLPEGWRQQLWSHFEHREHRETRESRSALNALIESWRPSTGDTDGTAEQWRLDEREIDGGFAGTEYPRLWPPRQAALPKGTPAGTTYRSSGTVQRGLHGEPAWGVDRPVHGHTEQTGDGHG